MTTTYDHRHKPPYHPLPPELAQWFELHPVGYQPEGRPCWRSTVVFPNNMGWLVLLYPSKTAVSWQARYQFESTTTFKGTYERHHSPWLHLEAALGVWARCLLEDRCVWEPINDE